MSVSLNIRSIAIHSAIWILAFIVRVYLLSIHLGDKLLLLDFAMYCGYFYLNVYFISKRFFRNHKPLFFFSNLAVVALFSFIQAYATVVVFGNTIVIQAESGDVSYILDNSLRNQWTLALYSNVIVFVLSFAYSIYQSTLQQEKEKQEIINTGLLNQLSQMRSQVNPKLIISILEKIDRELEFKSSDKIADSLERLSEIMRYMISRKGKHQVRLQHEINQAGILSSLLNTSGENSFKAFSLPELKNNDLNIEATLLLSLVETAYLIDSKKQALELAECSLENDDFTLAFKLDEVPEKKLTALEKLKERLQALYPDNAVLSIPENPEPRLKLELKLV